jgi:hypothetical protein
MSLRKMRKTPNGFILILVFFATYPTMVVAQDTIVVRPGDEVRMTSLSGERTASVVRIERDSVFLKRCRECSAYSVPYALANQVEVSRPQRGGHGILGMGIGFLAGGAIGAFILAPCPHGNSGADGPPCGLGQAETALATAVLGLFVGAVVGDRFLPSKRWVAARWP